MPLRYAITLDTEGPDLNLIVDLFGKERCLHLAQSALKFWDQTNLSVFEE